MKKSVSKSKKSKVKKARKLRSHGNKCVIDDRRCEHVEDELNAFDEERMLRDRTQDTSISVLYPQFVQKELSVTGKSSKDLRDRIIKLHKATATGPRRKLTRTLVYATINATQKKIDSVIKKHRKELQNVVD
jgi:hypothetical protein